jgi:cytochrome P450
MYDRLHQKRKLTDSSIAGSDTTAVAITSILYHLMRTPAAYAKLTAEIDEADNSGTLSPTVQYNEAVGFPYLMACCKEDDFVPERWFMKDAARMERYMFQFGGGLRTCIGKNVSQTQEP